MTRLCRTLGHLYTLDHLDLDSSYLFARCPRCKETFWFEGSGYTWWNVKTDLQCQPLLARALFEMVTDYARGRTGLVYGPTLPLGRRR